MNAKNITKEEVIAELRKLQSEGHSMKIGDFECWLKYEIRKHFGGYKNAKSELGVDVKKLPGGGRKSRHTDEEVKALLERLLAEGRTSNYVYEKHKDVIDWFHHNHGGGLARACIYYEIAKFERPTVTRRKKKWTDERIANEIRSLDEKQITLSSNYLKTIGHHGLVSAVKNRYGSWNSGLIALGYRPVLKNNWSRERIKSETISAILSGVRPTVTSINDKVPGYMSAVTRYFKSFSEVKGYCGFCNINDKPKDGKQRISPYRPKLTTKEGLMREIYRLYYVGAPLNYRAIQEKKKHILNASKTLYGSWREALEHCGFDYDGIIVTDNSLSKCGEYFENVLGNMLSELGVSHTKYSHERFDPDFVLPSGEWIDAKLSEWTDTSEMVKRYLPECESLTIVYLRGAKEERQRGYKYPHKTVSAYLLADKLSEERRKYYYERFTEIENKASAGEIGSHSA